MSLGMSSLYWIPSKASSSLSFSLAVKRWQYIWLWLCLCVFYHVPLYLYVWLCLCMIVCPGRDECKGTSVWLSWGTAFPVAVATSARHHCFEVGELSLFHFLFDFLSFSFFVWIHRHWKMMPQGQYRLCSLWIYSPILLKGENKLFLRISLDSSYFYLNWI